MNTSLQYLTKGLPVNPLPLNPGRSAGVPHAPMRGTPLDSTERKLAVRNALRYFPKETHTLLAPEFMHELSTYGHIYMYRFRPTQFVMRAYPIDQYPARHKHAAAIMLMIMNNLDHSVAQFPEELVTYGGNGQVFSNWAQFWLVMAYLSRMTDQQTLTLYSGHPMGLFPSSPSAPRVVVTNGMMIPNYCSRDLYDKFFALGVTQYGQMTAGSYCYIGPQGIVHGTTITVLNAARRYLGTADLAGRVFVTSGLGGMSGAQAKAATIAGCVAVIAEVDETALRKRESQGWLMEVTDDLDNCIELIKQHRTQKTSTSIGYLGNVVDLWEKIVHYYELTGVLLVDLGSDQTSCHNPFNGGYYPAGISYAEANQLMSQKPDDFKNHVQKSLRRHIAAIERLAAVGLSFWDYGNAFLLECSRAGADVLDPDDKSGIKFKYPSYVQDIMGDIFSMGFGPFRWVCASGLEEDLIKTDQLAGEVIKTLIQSGVPEYAQQQYEDNLHWIEHAHANKMVVGSQARILYSDAVGRVAIALRFNEAVSSNELEGPVVISRDHHDVSGTDSPFRETSNVTDGSAFTADMSVHNFVGDAFRGATWVSLHNGGGVGWGSVMNGGFGMVLDGTAEAAAKAKGMLTWDVANGVARRAWSGNDYAQSTIHHLAEKIEGLEVTVCHNADEVEIQ